MQSKRRAALSRGDSPVAEPVTQPGAARVPLSSPILSAHCNYSFLQCSGLCELGLPSATLHGVRHSEKVLSLAYALPCAELHHQPQALVISPTLKHTSIYNCPENLSVEPRLSQWGSRPASKKHPIPSVMPS
ncbi:mCG1038318 [Mus musculus]|nr:mCG1038318 [Mus musculus]